MEIKHNTPVQNIELQNLYGTNFNTEKLSGKPYMISFFRFASCPFCNMRVNELISRHGELSKEFTIVAIFDSSLENLQKNNENRFSPFPILADSKNIYYKKYGIKKSVLGMLIGIFTRFPVMIKGLLAGYFPLPPKGSLITMPADFLVDRNGIIQKAYYGKDEGDHLDFEQIKNFSFQ